MNNKLDFKINGVAVVLYFGFACFKNLSELWNVPGYQAVLQRLTSFGAVTDDLGMDQIDMIGDVIYCALRANPDKQPEFTADQIKDDLLCDVLRVVDVVTCLVAVVQKPANPDQAVAGKAKPSRKKSVS